MKKVEDYINQSESSYFYKKEYEALSKEQKERVKQLAVELDNEGAKDPISWAMSEVKENIPQFSRFLFLKGIFDIIDDVEGNIGLADDIDESYDEDIFEILAKLEEQIGKKECYDFLKSFSKGVIWQVLNFIDDGNYNSEGKPMWNLKEYETERFINGLHENFNDFEEELK